MDLGIPKGIVPDELEAISLQRSSCDLSDWTVVNRITNVARGMAYADERVQVGTAAVALLRG
ncbi:MAG: hypothetical protein L6R43_07260 [Planctomycetes bacterium]|nr:hypothetical protein [Planctomycetota bacterium]MCK6531060.1 hypothetical protein [Myxococcota bacterium]